MDPIQILHSRTTTVLAASLVVLQLTIGPRSVSADTQVPVVQLNPVTTIDLVRSLQADARTSVSAIAVHSLVAQASGLYFLVDAAWPAFERIGSLRIVHTDHSGKVIRTFGVPSDTVRSLAISVDESGRVGLFHEGSSDKNYADRSFSLFDETGRLTEEHKCDKIPRAVFRTTRGSPVILAVFDDTVVHTLHRNGAVTPRFEIPRIAMPSMPMFVGTHGDSLVVVEALSGTIVTASLSGGISAEFQPNIAEFTQAAEIASRQQPSPYTHGEAHDILIHATSMDEVGRMYFALSNIKPATEGALIVEYESDATIRRRLRCVLPRFDEYKARFVGDKRIGSPHGVMAPALIGASSNRLFIADRKGKVANYVISEER